MYKAKIYYLVCKTDKELIDEGTSINRLRNLKAGLIKGTDTAHTNHSMHIIDDDGKIIDDEENVSR